MRAWLVAALLALSACAGVPAKHAMVAVAASDVLTSVGETLQSEMNADYADAGGAAATPDAVAKLDAQWTPLLSYYGVATRALDAYVAAIRDADKHKDPSLIGPPARAMLAAWVKVQAIGDALGIAVPAPPDTLQKAGVELVVNGGQ